MHAKPFLNPIYPPRAKSRREERLVEERSLLMAVGCFSAFLLRARPYIGRQLIAIYFKNSEFKILGFSKV
jgi:hypothetical protein